MLLHPKNSSKTHEKCRLKPIKVDIGTALSFKMKMKDIAPLTRFG